MSGPANKRIKHSIIDVSLDGKSLEIPESLHGSLTAVHAHLESLTLRRQSLLCSLTVDGVSVRLEKPIVPLKVFRRVEAVSMRFDKLTAHLVPSLRRKLRQLHNRSEVASEVAMINEWNAAQKLWWDLLPDLKEPILILNVLAGLPKSLQGGVDFVGVLSAANDQLNRVLEGMDEAFQHEDPIALSDKLEQGLCVWLEQLELALSNFK